MALPQLVLTRYSHLLTLMLQNYFTINLSGSFAEKKLKRGLVTLKDNPTIFQANTHKGRALQQDLAPNAIQTRHQKESCSGVLLIFRSCSSDL